MRGIGKNIIRKSISCVKNRVCISGNKKFFSTTHKDTSYPDILKKLFESNIKKKKIPCFEVYSSQIEILNQPIDFYLAILVCFSFLFLFLF